MRFCIAGLTIETVSALPISSFLSDDGGKEADVQIAFTSDSYRDQAREESHYSDGIAVYWLPNRGWLFKDRFSSHREHIYASTDYACLSINEQVPMTSDFLTRLVRLPLECRFVQEGILSLHAACVEQGGRAVCFTGDSGIGKSTRAQAWTEALDAEFISGDRPAIRMEKDGATVCGVPWDGKEQVFRNVERPLHAILEVRRAPFTRLRRLDADQAYRVLINQSFIPMWDEDRAVLAMGNVRRLSRSLPVYRLFCGPDTASALETYRILFKCTEEIQEELADMRIRDGFTLRNVADEYMVMPTGENISKFGGAVVLSDVAAFIFEQLKQPISREDLLSLVLAEFDVDEATATADMDVLLAQFSELELLEE